MNLCALILVFGWTVGPARALFYPICGAPFGVSCSRIFDVKWSWPLEEEKPEEPAIESITLNLIRAFVLVMEPLAQFCRKIHNSCVKMVYSQPVSISSNYYIIVLAAFGIYIVLFTLLTSFIGFAYVRNLKNDCKNRLREVFKFKPKPKRPCSKSE